MRSAVFLVSGVAVLLASATPARAYFERLFVSSRALSMGGAFVSVADDASAAVINPAGLTQLPTASFLSSFNRPYELGDLEEHYLAASLPLPFGTMGLSWHRFGLRGVTSEDLFTVAFGADYIRNSQDASLSFGGSIDIARVGYASNDYPDAKTVVTGSLSMLLRPFPVFGFGYSIRNLGQPSFDWVAGDGGTGLRTTQAFGLSYHWQQRAVFAYERSMGQNGKWTDAIGVEVEAVKQLRIRGGLQNGDVTGGLGVTVSRIVVDAGVASHRVLGLTYHISLGFSLAPKNDRGYPGE